MRKGASSALQRASTQLRGEKLKRSALDDDDDEDIGAYLSSLSRKATGQPQWDKFDELSDISISSDDSKPQPAATNKFLKKKSKVGQEENNASSKFTKPQASSGAPAKSKVGAASQGGLKGAGSSALDRAAAYSNKYSTSAASKKEVVRLSESDMDMSFSMDSEVVADVQKSKAAAVIKPKDYRPYPAPRRRAPSSPDISQDSELAGMEKKYMKKQQPSYANVLSDDDSVSIGKGGNRFMKKKAPVVKKPDEAPPPPPKNKKPTAAADQQKSMFTLKSSERYATEVQLDTDEESMANYMDGLNSDRGGLSSGRTPRSDASSRTPRSPPPSARKGQSLLRHLSPEPMQDIAEKDTSISEDGSFKLNLMGLDELEVAPEIVEKPRKQNKVQTVSFTKQKDKKGKKSTSKTENKGPDIFSDLGLFTVDDLLGKGDSADPDGSIAEESESDDDSIEEVKTEYTDHNDYEFRSQPPLRSILSPSPRPLTPKSSRSRVRLSLDDVTEIRTLSPEIPSTARTKASAVYTEDFEDISEGADTIRTDQDSEAESIATERTASPTPRPRRGSRTRRYSEDSYYSDDFHSATELTSPPGSPRSHRYSRQDSRDSLVTDDYSSFSETRSRSPSPEPYRSRPKMKTAQVQTGLDIGLTYHWTGQTSMAFPGPAYGLGRVDPTPIASHVVGADALETLTAYSPSVIALNDMLRSQLQLTTSFLEMQKQMHQAFLAGSDPDFQYTTLEETKRYIKKQKKKRAKLTFDEALRQVKEEMGLS